MTYRTLFVILIVFLLLMNTSCQKEKKIQEKKIIIAVEELPNTLNPIFELNETARILIDILFQGLFDPTGDMPGNFKRSLAQDYKQNESNKAIYNIYLYQNKKWHDGAKFTAQDVLFSYQAYCQQDNQSPLRARIRRMIENIEIINNYHIKITFSLPVSPIDVPYLLSFKIIPSQYYGKRMPLTLENPTGLEFTRNPSGTGPYRVINWDNNLISFTQFDIMVNIPQIEVIKVIAPEIRVRKLLDNKVDLIFNVDPFHFSTLKENNFKYCDFIPYAYFAIAYNCNDFKLSDNQLRKALTRSTNKEALLKEAMLNEPINKKYINKGPFPHNAQRIYNSFENLLPYNISLARDLIAGCSLLDNTLTLIYPDAYGMLGERIAHGIKKNYRQIGLKIKVEEKGLNFFTKIKSKDYQMALIYEKFDRHYNILNNYYSTGSRNITQINDSDLDNTLLEWNNEIKFTKKLPLAREIHNKIYELSPYTFLFTIPQRAYYSKRLKKVNIVDPNGILSTISTWDIIR